MQYEMLARRFYAMAIGASLITGVLFVVGAYWHLDAAIYAGAAVMIVTAIAAVSSIVLTVIDAVACRLDERRSDDQNS